MANPFPFTAGQILTAAQLNGIGEAAITFTPTWTNFTRGNGTTVAYYMRVNKLVYVYVEETLGSTSAVTGNPTMTLPIAATRIRAIPNSRAYILDAGATVYWGTTSPSTAAAIDLFVEAANGTYVTYAFIGATIPMTWATNDKIAFAFTYEVA